MKTFIVCVTIVVVGCRPDWKPSQPGEIFRYTTVGRTEPLDSIVLGRPWPTAAKYGAKSGDSIVALPFGTFGGADAIAVHLTDGVVTRLEYAYHSSRNARALSADYRSTLGTPVAEMADTADGVVRTTTCWRNDSTAFAIHTMVPAGKDVVGAMAVLLDRRLDHDRGGLTRSCS